MKPQLVAQSGDAAALGATVTPEGVNFAVYSESASALYVSVFDAADYEVACIELDGHAGPLHFGLIAGIGAGTRYGLRADGHYDPEHGYHFDPKKLLVDPYAKRLDKAFVRSPLLAAPRHFSGDTAPLVPKGIVVDPAHKPARPRRKTPGLIYEMNVRGYTKQHPEVPELLRGTLAGLMAPRVVDHLNRLGIDTVELMPIGAFIDDAHLPALGLANAWGYNPVSYFAPDPRLAPGGIEELRALTDLYRKAGIGVILDVVYNHTGEGDAGGPILSLKGLDARSYYRHVEVYGRQVLVNDAGTGNTLRCDHKAVQRLVIDSLRYWIEAGGVSGFRFDLAPILGREPGFNPNAELIRMITTDPLLAKSLLIAEPWDPGPGGYQLGQFGKEFKEWNDTYRDDVRRFWRGERGCIGALAGKVAGSAEIFNFDARRPSNGVNFIAVHDGFTLADLVSYSHKHNDANGEHNRDGHDDNASWNCGLEGPTRNAAVLACRHRDMRAMLATLLVSRGTLLLQQGDEMGRTQRGNNNAYAQDNAITWLDWQGADEALIEFTAALTAFRKAHAALTHDHFLSGHERNGVRDVVWLHPGGREMLDADWHDPAGSVLGMWLRLAADEVLVWFNRRMEAVEVRLPAGEWAVGITSDAASEIAVSDGKVRVPARSVLALVRGA